MPEPGGAWKRLKDFAQNGSLYYIDLYSHTRTMYTDGIYVRGFGLVI